MQYLNVSIIVYRLYAYGTRIYLLGKYSGAKLVGVQWGKFAIK